VFTPLTVGTVISVETLKASSSKTMGHTVKDAPYILEPLLWVVVGGWLLRIKEGGKRAPHILEPLQWVPVLKARPNKPRIQIGINI
jgi:hypothetical protein